MARSSSAGQGAASGAGLALPLPDLMLGVAVAAVWGTNFVVIRLGLKTFPPLEFACLRFLFVFFPAMLFIPRPKIGWRSCALYGSIAGGGQFGLLFVALHGFISPGLASLVVQTQVLFTVAIAAFNGTEELGPSHLAAALLAAAGLLLIGYMGGGDATPAGLAMVIAAAFSWAVANMLMRRDIPGGMLSFVIWSSPFSVLPLLVLSCAFEGSRSMIWALKVADLPAWLALLWQASGNSLFGFAVWGRLLQRHPAVVVAPLALLVPVFGMGSAALLIGERLEMWKIIAGMLILAGLAVNLFAGTKSAGRQLSVE